MAENQVQNPPAEKVIALSASLLEPFQGHPFRVASGEEMEQLKESIREYGVLSPLLVRPRGDGRYEIVSGHRRQAACEALGITELPVLVRNMTDDEAVILMMDSNIQREHILPSEKAFAYKMKMEAVKRTAGRPRKENLGQVVPNLGKRTTELAGEANACYREESADPAKLKALDKRMDALNQRLDNLIMMKASNQITLSQFVEQSNEIGVQQQRVNKEKAELLAQQGDHKALDMDAIEASLCEAVDFTDGMVSEWFIQNFVRRITPIDDTRFAWVLDLAPEPQTLVCEVNGRKEYPRITLESNLYRGAWPPSGASRQTFLINRNGRLNGDISAAGLAQDRQQSRILASNSLALM